MSDPAPVLDLDWNSDWLREPALLRVFDALNRDGVETRVVGGAVRDALRGHIGGDVDLATTAETGVVNELATKAGLKVVPTGEAHGTMTVISNGRPFEVTTLRHDVETHGRHATVAFGADWGEDARRRDFTMNALYADRTGRLYDPVGGYDDILAGRVRFIGDPRQRIREDYLRILRFFRFHAQFGSGDPDASGLAAVIHERRGLLGLSGERLRQELLRLLVAPGAVPTIAVMADCGIFGIVTGGVPQVASLDRYAGLEAEENVSPDAIMRLAALSVFIPEDADRLAMRLRLSNAERGRLATAADGWWHVGPALDQPARKALLYRIGATVWRDRTALAFARSGSVADDPGWRELMAFPDHWTPPVFPLKGADLIGLGIKSGPAIGQLLAKIEAGWIAGEFSADREALLKQAARLIA